MPISARGILATIAASVGQNGKISKVGTVCCTVLIFQFYKYIIVILKIIEL
jgi:hypothetical protein